MGVVKSILRSVLQAAIVFAFVIAGQYVFGAVGAFIGAAIGTAVASAVGNLIFGPVGGKRGADPDAGKFVVKVAEAPRWINCGECKQGGAIVFAEFDDVGNIWWVIVHSDSILDNVVNYYFDDIELTLDGSGNVTTDDFCLDSKKNLFKPTRTKVPYFQIWTTTYSETDPTPPAVSALIAALGSKWTADHKLVGTTYSVIKGKAIDDENRSKIYRWRGPLGLGEPGLTIVGEWSRAYDPRDETQDIDDNTTWKFTRNSALVWAWFRTHPYGRNKPMSRINWDMIAEQADICDQTVVGEYASHTRYRCDASIAENTERSLAETNIMMTCDGMLMFDDEGKAWLRVGNYYTPTVTLSRNRDIVAMESVEAENGESETQGVIVRYTDPEANYVVQPSAPWLNPTYYVEGVGATFLTLDVLFISDHNQAMRIAKSIGMRSQPIHKIAPVTGLRGLKARQERVVQINYDNTFSGDYEIATPVEVDESGMFCSFGAVPIDENRYDLLEGEEKPKPVVDGSTTTTALDNPVPVSFEFSEGRLQGVFESPNRLDVSYDVRYTQATGDPDPVYVMAQYDPIENIATSGPVATNVEYTIEYRARSSAGDVTDWVEYVDPVVTTGPVLGGGSGMQIPDVITAHDDGGGFARVDVAAHNITYDDGVVTAIDADSVIGLAHQVIYHIYYNNDDRTNGPFTFFATASYSTATDISVNSGRVYLGQVLTPPEGGAINSGGAVPSGIEP
jgi:hypothetical protein